MAIPPRFHRWPWKEPVEHEIDEELAFHVEMRANDLMSRGMAPAEARREAARRLGDPAKVRESVRAAALDRDRHMIRTQYLTEIRQDLAFTARQLLKKPSFALLAVFTLALGIGGTTSIFSALYAVVLKPLPLADPERLCAVGET